MKKLFTLICALIGMTATVSAATVDDIAVCKHSYVLVMDEATNNGAAKPGKGNLFGDGFFLDLTGGSVATNKGTVDLSDAATWGDAIAAKYAEYGPHLNCFRLKNQQDMIAMNVTAGSKLIIFYNGNNKSGTAARIPKISSDAAQSNVLNPECAPTGDTPALGVVKMEWTAQDDGLIYIGSWNGDIFLSYIIVEANEAPGTPSVKVGDQKFENGVFFREVTCKANTYEMEGMEGMQLPTVVTYTTDGTAPSIDSKIYTAPIKCYNDQTVKFQAFVDYEGDGNPDEICPNADNEGIVSFSFNAPAITVDEATNTVTIKSEYEDLGANVEYYYSYGDVADEKGSTFQLNSSATVTAYAKIINGSYDTFTTKFVTKDVYVLDAITEKTVINVIAGSAVKDAEASATQGTDVYVIEGGAINANSTKFFVKNLEFGAIANVDEANAQYQVPAGQEAYIKMNATNITFKLAQTAGVIVTCSKNACKNISSETVSDRACKVNVDGTVYGSDDITADYNLVAADGVTVVETLPGNIIKFDLTEGIHTFLKYSGTGNILISSIEILPGESVTGVSEVTASTLIPIRTVKVAKNGTVVIVNGDAEYTVAGAQMK